GAVGDRRVADPRSVQLLPECPYSPRSDVRQRDPHREGRGQAGAADADGFDRLGLRLPAGPQSVQRVPPEPAHDPHPRTVARSLMRRIRLAGKLAEPISHYTDGVEAGGVLHASGNLPRALSGDSVA